MKKVLLIGDSISLDYGPGLRALLRDDIAVFSRDGVAFTTCAKSLRAAAKR